MPKEKLEPIEDWIIYEGVTPPEKSKTGVILTPNVPGQRQQVFKALGKVLFAGPESKMEPGDEFIFQPGIPPIPIEWDGEMVYAIQRHMIVAKIVPVEDSAVC